MRTFVTLGPFVPEMLRGEIPKGSEMIRRVLDRGFDGIEVGLRIREYPFGACLLEELDATRVSLHSDFWEFNLASPNRYIRDAGVRQLVDETNLASGLGVKRLTFHPGFQGKRTDHGRSMEFLWDSLNRFCDQVPEPPDGLLCLENMDGGRGKLCTNADDIRETLNRFPFLRLTCDFAHLGKSGQDAEVFVQEFFDLIEHMHVSGSTEGRRHGDTSLRASDVDFRTQLRRFRDKDVVAVIENGTWELLAESKAVLDSL